MVSYWLLVILVPPLVKRLMILVPHFFFDAVDRTKSSCDLELLSFFDSLYSLFVVIFVLGYGDAHVIFWLFMVW